LKIWKLQLFIVICAFLKLFNLGLNNYIADLFNTTLLLFFTIEVIISILLNRIFKNIFLELINLLTTFFYILRIITLSREHVVSDLFERGGTIQNTNEALWVLIFQYFIIVTTTILFSPKIVKIDFYEFKVDSNRFNKYVWFLLSINLLYFLFFYKLGEFGFNSVSAIFLTVFNTANLLYLIIFNHSFFYHKSRKSLIIQIILILFIIVFSGNKSAIAQIILTIYFVMLLKNGTEVKIEYKSI
jgi:hypothetical protein